jgi:hypothetical protein
MTRPKHTKQAGVDMGETFKPPEVPDLARQRLAAPLQYLTIDCSNHTCIIAVPESCVHGADLQGAIALAISLDPKCKHIITLRGLLRDFELSKQAHNGRWACKAHNETVPEDAR